jgi:hypothetical protein
MNILLKYPLLYVLDYSYLLHHVLDGYAAQAHPKRTVTINDIINGVFEGRINFPKTKAEIVKEIEKNKDKPGVTPEVIDIMRNLPDRRYNGRYLSLLLLMFIILLSCFFFFCNSMYVTWRFCYKQRFYFPCVR